MTVTPYWARGHSRLTDQLNRNRERLESLYKTKLLSPGERYRLARDNAPTYKDPLEALTENLALVVQAMRKQAAAFLTAAQDFRKITWPNDL